VFENLLGQDEVVRALKIDVEAGRLPPAILFYGPPASGKLSAALELARALSCARPRDPGSPGSWAAWNCPCAACSRHRSLVHPDLALLGPRSFPEEISAALELLGRSPGPASAYFFARAARKLTRRFDAFLYEGEESRLTKAAGLLRGLEETLDAVAPERALPGALAPGADKAASESAALCAKLEAFVPGTPPVFMIRNIEFWARLAPLGPRKTVIIENADRMQDASRNALLKILEEPPDSVRFVLHSSRRSAVMTTILSRARTYHFVARDPSATTLVVERIFRSSEPAPSVESFLAARRAFPPAEARARAEAFLGAALVARLERETLAPPLAALAREARSVGQAPSAALADLLEATKDFGQRDDRFSSSFRSFLAALSATLGDILSEEGAGADAVGFVERAAALIRAASSDYETLNRSPGLLAESLLYALSEGRSP
jgi:DNA polymerase-3 subunit gamma/tau